MMFPMNILPYPKTPLPLISSPAACCLVVVGCHQMCVLVVMKIHRLQIGLLYCKPFHDLNKAGYTATEVACGWAGAVMKKAEKGIAGYRVACMRLKTTGQKVFQFSVYVFIVDCYQEMLIAALTKQLPHDF